MKKTLNFLAVTAMALLVVNLSSTPAKAATSVALPALLPYISSGCGVGSTIIGVDNKFVVTMGDTSQDSNSVCTVNFGTPQVAAPVCFYNDDTDAIAMTVQTSTNAVTVNYQYSGFITLGSKISVACL